MSFVPMWIDEGDIKRSRLQLLQAASLITVLVIFLFFYQGRGLQQLPQPTMSVLNT